MKKIDLTGQTFGELKVVEEDKETTSKGVHWKCICKNGHISSRSSNSLRNNKYNIVCQQCRARGDLTGQTFGRLKDDTSAWAETYNHDNWDGKIIEIDI